jgi:putative transposase
MGAKRRAGARLHASRPLADADFPGRLALRPPHRTLLFDGPINGECFRAYVQQVLLPQLRPGDIVIMDNLGSHKSAALRNLIKAAGARLWYLPPYSPDLNPIEQTFAKIKHWMRSAQKRSIDDICSHIAGLITTIQPNECSNYFKNAGYASIKM